MFEGVIHDAIPAEWDKIELVKENPLLDREFLDIVRRGSNIPFRLVTHPAYCCAEYTMRLNVLSFSRFFLPIKVTIICVPVSIGSKGYVGDIKALIQDYKRRKGIYIILNDDKKLPKNKNRTTRTLPTCVFYNTYENFEEYLNTLRSSYRRRIITAMQKGSCLTIKQINNSEFTEEMYQLYLNVVTASKYPLEILSIDFFRLFKGQLFCFYDKDTPVAFVLLKNSKDTLYFVFGGMDYNKRAQYDLYYNMLILVIQQGLAGEFSKIDFGQTAESSKLRVGCKCQDRYMHVMTGNKLLDALISRFINIFGYQLKDEGLRAFKKHNQMSVIHRNIEDISDMNKPTKTGEICH